MKNILFVCLLIFSNNIKAEWVNFATLGNGDVLFFDKGSIQKNGNSLTVWTRIQYKNSVMGALSYQNFIKIDCSEYSTITLQSTYYIDSNWSTPAMATDTKEKPKVYITTNSSGELLANLLCE